MRLLSLSISLLVIMLPSIALSGEPSKQTTRRFYKYTDEQNVTVISTSLPPEAIHKGYTILNAQGQEQEKVDPRSYQAVEKAQQEAKEQRDNAKLLKLFDTVEDIQQYKENQINEMTNVEEGISENIKQIENQITRLKALVLSYKTKKQVVPEHFTQELQRNENLLNENVHFLKRKQLEKHQFSEHYDRLIKRFKILKNPYKPAAPPGAPHD